MQVGDGATICYVSDRYPATIVEISPTEQVIFLQEDHAVRTDNNGMSELQEYAYTRNPDARKQKATRRKDGSYRLVANNTLVRIGERNRYYDFSY